MGGVVPGLGGGRSGGRWVCSGGSAPRGRGSAPRGRGSAPRGVPGPGVSGIPACTEADTPACGQNHRRL